MGANVADLLMPPALAEHFRVELVRAREAAAAGALAMRFETTARRADGTEIPIEVGLSAVKVDEGDRPYFAASVRDLSQQREAMRQLAETEQCYRQAQKMEAMGRLAGGVAHDFNNLLTIINGYVELSTQGLSAGDPLRKDLEHVARAGTRASSLTRQLLAFSRKQILEPRVVDVAELVTSTSKMLGRMIGEDISLTVQGESGHRVRVDPDQLGQVLMNLVVNARDAMPDGGQLRIATTAVGIAGEEGPDGPAPGRYVALSVQDTGCGIPEEVREHLFEPFFTTKPIGKGTGLGLATVIGIVRQSGGTVKVDSAPGKGATFCVLLPAVADGIRDVAGAAEGLATTGGRGETVLVVEDEVDLLALAERILRGAGYRVLQAANAGEALLIAEQHETELHLVLTDVVMPRMSGIALAERLARVRPGLRVAFTSGFAQHPMLEREGARAVPHLLHKPYSAQALLRHVRQALESRDGEQHAQ